MTPALRARLAAGLLALAGPLLVAPARAEPEADCPPTPAQPTPEELQTLGQTARDHGYLWRITKEDRSSWLYGTIHVARRDWVFPGPRTSAALRSVDTIALELDPMAADVQQGLAKGFAALRRPALPVPLEERLARQAAADCLPEARLAAMPPAVRAMTLTALVGRRDGLDPAYGIDAVLAAFGHARGLEVTSLETPALQVSVLDPGNDEATVAWVDATLGAVERGSARAQLARMSSAWAEGDLATLAGFADWCDCVHSPAERAMQRRVLDDRNPGLADGIDALHTAGKRVFAAVGSLHMVGPLGLPALLAARGYTVERIDFGAP